MKTLAIIGAQWGDEGKGKIADLLGAKCDYMARYQGGNNAGHTIIVGEKKIVLHLIPSGIMHKDCTALIGHGVVFDPQAFVDELNYLKNLGTIITPQQLKISSEASLITSYHKLFDQAREGKGPQKIGTTGKGIGPCYEDKIARRGLRLSDLKDRSVLKTKLERSLHEKNPLFEFYQVTPPTLEEETQRLFELGKVISPFLGDTFTLLNNAHENGKTILYEGAQGVLLDIDYGSYPYVTSSNTAVSGIYSGAGLPGPNAIDEVLGVAKAYTTRVGEGPFPTELNDEDGKLLQAKGNEFGATTGRKRRCGWPDLPLLKYAVKASKMTSLALTKVDILSGVKTFKVCTHYEVNGKKIDMASPGLDLAKVKPLYKELRPFHDDFKSEDFSQELLEYITLIEETVGVPVGIVAFGPERSEIAFRKNYF